MRVSFSGLISGLLWVRYNTSFKKMLAKKYCFLGQVQFVYFQQAAGRTIGGGCPPPPLLDCIVLLSFLSFCLCCLIVLVVLLSLLSYCLCCQAGPWEEVVLPPPLLDWKTMADFFPWGLLILRLSFSFSSFLGHQISFDKHTRHILNSWPWSNN